MIEDLFESAKQTWAERLASPLLGGFVASWGLWNWKFLVILFSDASVTTTFKLVETVAFPDLTSKVLYGFMFPLASALAYVFVYPYPALKIYEFTLRRQRESNQAKQKISDEILLSEAETIQFKEKYKEWVKSKNAEIEDLNEEVKRLTSEINAAGANPKLRSSIKLTTSQIEILQALKNAGGERNVFELMKLIKSDKFQVDFDLTELSQLGLIKNYDKYGNDVYIVEFTHKGRGYVIENDL